jgi:hypothetical protein
MEGEVAKKNMYLVGWGEGTDWRLGNGDIEEK